MDHNKVIALGWRPRHKNFDTKDRNIQYGLEEYIMSVLFNYEDDFHLVSIKDAEGVNVNVWENSEQLFYGMIKTDSDLKNIMRFVGIIEY